MINETEYRYQPMKGEKFWYFSNSYGHFMKVCEFVCTMGFFDSLHWEMGHTFKSKDKLLEYFFKEKGITPVQLKTNSFITRTELNGICFGTWQKVKQNIFGYFNCKKLLKEIDVRNEEQKIAEFLIGNEPIVLLDNICPILEKRRYISKKELFSLFNPLPKLNAGSADR